MLGEINLARKDGYCRISWRGVSRIGTFAEVDVSIDTTTAGRMEKEEYRISIQGNAKLWKGKGDLDLPHCECI